MHIIYIDDEPVMLKAFKRAISKRNDIESVGCFDDPSDAVKYIKKNCVDIAFIDRLMPKTDGKTLAKKLKKLNPNLYIVFVSALEMNDIDEKVKFDDYIMKPFSCEDIDKVFEHYYKRKA